MIEVVIFDLDGVLTDTAELHFQSWLRVAEEIDVVVEDAVKDQIRGPGRMESLEIVLGERSGEFSDEQKDELALKKLQMQFWFREATTELEVEKALLLQNLYRSMIDAIEALAAADGYDMVIIDDASVNLTFDRDTRVPPQVQVLQQIASRKILYRNPALNITLDLATRMNNLYRAP